MSFSLFTGIDPGEKYSSCFVVGVVLGWIPDMRGRISKYLVVIVVSSAEKANVCFFLTWVFDNVIDWRKGGLHSGDTKDAAPGTRAIHVLSVFRSLINACSFLLDGNNRLLDYMSRYLVVVACQAVLR